MEMRLQIPWDTESPKLDTEEVARLKEHYNFLNELEWIVYQAKVIYEGFRNSSAAIITLEEGFKKYPWSSDLMFCLAECLSRNPQTHKRALEYCEKGLEKDPRSDYGHTIKSRIFFDQKKVAESYLSAMKAIKINKSNFEAGVYLGITGFSMGFSREDLLEMEMSIKNLKTTQKLNPNSKKLAEIIKEYEHLYANQSITQSKGCIYDE